MTCALWRLWVRVRDGEATTLLRYAQLLRACRNFHWWRRDGD